MLGGTPKLAKNWGGGGGALIEDSALNRANTVRNKSFHNKRTEK